MRTSSPPLDGITLRAPAGATNPRANHRPAKPIALQGLHDPRKLAGAVLWCLAGWAVFIGLGWAAFTLIRLALGAT
jgi:hypothetical protein